MTRLLFLACVLGLAAGPAAAGPVAAAQCAAKSPAHAVALVELYTSEGCDSCPPADHWLSSLRGQGFGPERVVPIALHVDYWDYIGWKDPYAQQRFSNRQRKMAQLARAAIVYTPQVLLQGRDFRDWRSPEGFAGAVARINAKPAAARLSLAIADRAPGVSGREALEVAVEAELLDPLQRADAALFLGAYENKLVSEVRAGENRGRTLPHDYVVLQWVGPLEFREAKLAVRERLPLLPKAVAANSGVVAFVQNRASGEVLQALMRPACGG